MAASPLRRIALVAAPFLFVAAVGILLRVDSFKPEEPAGFDEQMYSTYVDQVSQRGPGCYPELVQAYLKAQSTYPIALLPPTRTTFIVVASAWRGVFGGSSLACIRAVSCVATILVLLIAGAFAWRIRGRSFALAIFALMAVAPTQIYIAHWALIDGFFTLITLPVLWGFWELLQESHPARIWLALYSVGLILLVLTKENAIFVYVAMLGLLATNRWLKLGRITRPLIIATLASPLVGVCILVICAGGIEPLVAVFSLNAAKSVQTPYAITTGDGPWFRYLIDLFLVSPAVMIFAMGGAFSLKWNDRVGRFFLAFIFFSYLLMCNVPYGMNLRYANMWDFPLRYLALGPVFLWTESFAEKWKGKILAVSVVILLCVFELANYLKIFVGNTVDDPIPSRLMQALEILKP